MEHSESIDNEHHECTICLQSYLPDQGVLKCKHSFCYTCIEDWSKQENTCPLCKVRFVYIERISKDDHEEPIAVGSKRKAKPKKNKRTTVKKKSQSDVKPHSRVMNAQDAYMHHMLQTYIAQQMRVQQYEEEEDDEENDSDGDSDANNYFRYSMINRHGLAMPGRHSGLFGRSATMDLTGNSSNNPINLMEDDETPNREAVRTASNNSRSSSSSANRSTAVIDLASDDSGVTSTTTTMSSSSSSSSSAQTPVDLTVVGSSGNMSMADRARIYELIEDELDELDEDYAEEQSEDEDEDEECEWDEACQCPNCRPTQRLLDNHTAGVSSASSSVGRTSLSSSTSGAVSNRGSCMQPNQLKSTTNATKRSVSFGKSNSNNRDILDTVSTLVRAASAPLSRTLSRRAPSVRGGTASSSSSNSSSSAMGGSVEATPPVAQTAPLASSSGGGRLTRTQSLQGNK